MYKNKKNEPKREPFDLDNHWKTNFKYNHLGSHDFPLLSPNGDDIVLTIKEFYREEVVSPNKSKDMCNIVAFVESKLNGEIVKPMIVNKTNFKNLAAAFGTDKARSYIGQSVAIYVKKNVKFGSNYTDALRFRDYKPETTKPPIGANEAKRAAKDYAKNGNLDRWHKVRTITAEQEQRIIELSKAPNNEKA